MKRLASIALATFALLLAAWHVLETWRAGEHSVSQLGRLTALGLGAVLAMLAGAFLLAEIF